MAIVLNWPSKSAAMEQAAIAAESPQPLVAISASESEDRLIQGDNLSVAAALLSTHRGRFDLIAIDPPFAAGMDFQARITTNSGRQRVKAYGDKWQNGVEGYLDMIVPRLILMTRLLKPEGSMVVHCDWRVSHHIRSLLDELMPGGFRNQIAWIYSRTGRGAKAHARQFPRNHDQLIWAAKGPNPKFFGDVFIRHYSEKEAKRRGFRQDEKGRWYKTAPRGDYTDESIERLRREERIHITSGGKIRIKYFLPMESGAVVEKLPVGDAWLDIPDAMHLSKAEQTGYATQKPLRLQERLISALTEPGDLVGDFFCGSGSTLVAASRLGRRYVGCDMGELAIHTAFKRLGSSPPALHVSGSPVWMDVDLNVVRHADRLTLSSPDDWPVHSELRLNAAEWIDSWSVGRMGPKGFESHWTSRRENGRLSMDCRRGYRDATHIMVWDVLGRRVLKRLSA